MFVQADSACGAQPGGARREDRRLLAAADAENAATRGSSTRISLRGGGCSSSKVAPTPPPADAEKAAAAVKEAGAEDKDERSPEAKLRAAGTAVIAAKRMEASARMVAGNKKYIETDALKALLTHDEELGGTPIKLVRARWLLERFQAGSATAHLGEQLARFQGDAASLPTTAVEMHVLCTWHEFRPKWVGKVYQSQPIFDAWVGEAAARAPMFGAYVREAHQGLLAASATILEEEDGALRKEMEAWKELKPPPEAMDDPRVRPALDRLRAKLASACPECTEPQPLPPAQQPDLVLGHRQLLERESPEAFAGGPMLERILREAAESYDVKDAEHENVMSFPGVVAMSHCWLALDHPDPEGRNLREKWLPAIEWYYSERMNRYYQPPPDTRSLKAEYAGLSDAELLERCDFGIFIECVRAARTRRAPPLPPRCSALARSVRGARTA